MVYTAIEDIRQWCAELFPEAVFEVDTLRMLNVKIDTVKREKIFVYIEEPQQSYYAVPYRGWQTQRLPLTVYFCTFEPMHNTGYEGDSQFSKASRVETRLELRAMLEEEYLRPFLQRLKASDYVAKFPAVLDSVRVVYPASRFDANEVSVGVELTLRVQVCLDAYNKPSEQQAEEEEQEEQQEQQEQQQ